jgi:tetratricopeptide (TPR) repeat protein
MASVLAGDFESAIAALERTRALTRSAPRGFRVHALVALADLYAEQRHDLALAGLLVRECLELVPNYSNAHFIQGKLFARAGDLYEARNAFGNAIAAGKHDGEQFVVDNEIAIWKAHSEIGATLMRERRYAEALAWFELAAGARPEVQPLILNRARCHEALGQFGAAEGLFAIAFERFSDQLSAVEWINYFLRRGRHDEAAAAINAALERLPADDHALLLGTAAAVHLRAGRHDQAAAAVRRALDGDGGAAATIGALAEHLHAPELADLLPVSASTRPAALRIAYMDER